MSRRRIEVTTRTIDGRQVVLVDPADYELLISIRRQVGADRTHSQRLRLDLNRVRQQLDTVRAEVDRISEEANSEPCRCDGIGTCARCRVLELVGQVGFAIGPH